MYEGIDMKSIKCNSCGANIDYDKSSKTYKCPYCGTNFVNDFYEDENKLKSFFFDNENMGVETSSNSGRPKLNILIFLILLAFSVWPAIIYAIVVAENQSKWDREHTNEKK